MTRPTTGVAKRALRRDHHGTTGWNDTALLMIVVTSGMSPAAADMANDVDPWQWMIALTCSAPVSATTVRTAAGWSCSAALSSVHSFAGKSIDARQFSSHTS